MRTLHLPVGLALTALATAQGGPELLDYLITDVCQDGNGNQIPGDPATCGSHRNVNIGEHLPFLLTDVDHNNNGATYFAFSSFPIHAQDNTLKVMISKSGQGNFDANYAFNWVPARDGYDLIDQTFSSYASIIRTSDGGCYDQIWSNDGSAATIQDRAGGWILFPYGEPSTWPQSASTYVTTYHVQVTGGLSNSACQNGHSKGVTYWNAPASFTFESGKTLTAIREFHYANTDLSSQNNALELYYFSKEYGATRWEAWQPQSRCFAENGGSGAPLCHPENPSTYPLQGRCSVLVTSSTGIPGLDTWGNQNWVRTDCRDLTNYIALNTPTLMLDDTMAQNDGIVDINYAETINP